MALSLELSGARGNNLKGVDVTIPLRLLPSASPASVAAGKSTLVNDTLHVGIARELKV